MLIAPNVKCQRVLVLALWLVILVRLPLATVSCAVGGATPSVNVRPWNRKRRWKSYRQEGEKREHSKTSGQINLTKKPHRCRAWTVVPILYNGPPLSVEIAPCFGGSGPRLIHGSLGPQPKRHLDRFSRCYTAHDRDRPTTGHATPCVQQSATYVVLRCGIKTLKT